MSKAPWLWRQKWFGALIDALMFMIIVFFLTLLFIRIFGGQPLYGELIGIDIFLGVVHFCRDMLK